jgi:hypothetical protein
MYLREAHNVPLEYRTTNWNIAPPSSWCEEYWDLDLDETTICYPLVYNNEEFWDYGVCKHTGYIWSHKRNFWQIMIPNTSGKSSYPKVVCDKVTIPVHIAVMETLNEIPKPNGVTDKEWKITPNSVKKFCRKGWYVNHIDHDKTNFNPSNLEWVTATQNAQAYQKFIKKAA